MPSLARQPPFASSSSLALTRLFPQVSLVSWFRFFASRDVSLRLWLTRIGSLKRRMPRSSSSPSSSSSSSSSEHRRSRCSSLSSMEEATVCSLSISNLAGALSLKAEILRVVSSTTLSSSLLHFAGILTTFLPTVTTTTSFAASSSSSSYSADLRFGRRRSRTDCSRNPFLNFLVLCVVKMS